jgi:outer membrane protein OmpA-like peptidoglycan-associated protein
MKTGTRITAVLVLAAVAGAGCTTVNPYTREQQTSKAVTGAAIGAAVGAVAGALTGDNSRERRQRALIGAGVGGLTGGGVGYYMDVQEAKLRQQLEGSGVSVTRNGDEITLNMPSNVTFATNSADLNSQFFGTLDSVALVLKEYDKTLVDVLGHTDNTGGAQLNQELSQRRAATVGNYLLGRGVAAGRIIQQGFGYSRPVATNDTAEGRQANRRVEIVLSPIRQ